MLAFHEVPLGGGDDVRCRRCPVAAAPSPPEVDAAVQRIDDVLAGEAAQAGVFFTGIGSVDQQDLLRLVEHAARSGVQRIGVRISGRPLSAPMAAEDLLRRGARIVEVTFLGSCADTHDRLAGSPGGLDAAFAAVRNVLDAGERLGVRVAVRGRVPVCRHNLQDLPATVMSLAQSGVSSILLACDETLDPRRSADWVAAACDTGTVNRVWVAVSGLGEDELGDKALHAVDAIAMNEVAG
jgi:MoaA/NifB/PqqE/SkfB family radical SAM enzyme